MSESMRRTLIILFTMFVLAMNASAQVSPAKNEVDTNDVFLNFELPPLDVLFENVKQGPSWDLHTLKIEELNRKLVSEKRSWYQFLSIAGTYQYGVMGINSFTDLGSDVSIIYQTSGGEQIWYNLGVSLKIPLDVLVDKKNRNKSKRLVVDQAKKEMEIWFEERKIQIVEQYTKSEEMLINLKSAIENYSMLKMTYETAEKDYIMGALTMSELSVISSQKSIAIQQVSKIRGELKTAILKLEILSCTKLFYR